MSEMRVPTALLHAVRRDLRPVRPLASPARRALALVPIAVVLLIGMPLFWAWQAGVPLAPWPSHWGVSAVEAALALLLLGAGFREAIPGRELSAGTLTALTVVVCIGFLFLNATADAQPAVPLDHLTHWIWECVSMTITFSVPALAAPAWLVSRALPNRPALSGALCGLGVGVMADSGLRLFCWGGTNVHVILGHAGAIAILVVLGALSASVVERLKERR
jgi:hypothetical protein